MLNFVILLIADVSADVSAVGGLGSECDNAVYVRKGKSCDIRNATAFTLMRCI